MPSQHRSARAPQPHVLILGGAYGGLSTATNLLNLSDGKPQLHSPIPIPSISGKLQSRPRISVLDSRDGFFHQMGAPSANISATSASEFWKPYKNMRKFSGGKVQFLRGNAIEVHMDAKYVRYVTSENEERHLWYDYLVVATGMKRAWPVVPRVRRKSEYLLDVARNIKELARSKKIVLVGGGAVGVEMAGEIKLQFPDSKLILVHSHARLLNSEPLPDAFKDKALEVLERSGVKIVLETRVIGQTYIPGSQTELQLNTGELIFCDKVIWTSQSQGPNSWFLPNETLDDDNYVKTRTSLQFPEGLPYADAHFAVGDAVAWSGIRCAGGAMVMGQVAATNIVELMLSKERGERYAQLSDCPPFPPMMALTVGEATVGYMPGSEVMSGGKEVREEVIGGGLGFDRIAEYFGLR